LPVAAEFTTPHTFGGLQSLLSIAAVNVIHFSFVDPAGRCV
jgi:hypothetical protein